MPLSRDPSVRLSVFVEAGLVRTIPTGWQLIQGQLEMAPYVLLPDRGDDARYAGAALSHPFLRTPLVLREVGLDHLRIGHGMHAQAESLYRHLNIVYHEGMPVYDLQLIQTIPNGLKEFRRYTDEIERGATKTRRRQRRRADLVIPDAAGYRRKFLEMGGWIDRAGRFDYPTEDEIPAFLRPEFCSLVAFVNHCARAYPAKPRIAIEECSRLWSLVHARFRDERYVSQEPAMG